MTPAEVEAPTLAEAVARETARLADLRDLMTKRPDVWTALPMLCAERSVILDALSAQAVELERMREALEQIADGSAPPIPHGHYLAHRRAVDVARVALSVKAG